MNQQKASLEQSINSLIYLKEFENRKLLSQNAEIFRKFFLNHFIDNQTDHIRFKYSDWITDPSAIRDNESVPFNIYHYKFKEHEKNSSYNDQAYFFNKSFHKQRRYLNDFIKSKKFEYFLIILIIADSLSKAALVNDPNMNYKQVFFLKIIQIFYIFMFLIEILIKFFVDFKLFWKSPWNIFDLANLLVLILLELLSLFVNVCQNESNLIESLKYLIVFRVFTNIKILSHFIELRIILICLTKAVRSVFLISILLFILTYIYSEIGCILFSNSDNNMNDYFSSIFESLATLYAIMTLDQWWKIFTKTSDQTNSIITTLYFISWVILASFIFQNLFTGVMVNNFQEIREEVVKNLDLKRLKKAKNNSIKLDHDFKTLNTNENVEQKNMDSNDSEWCKLIKESSDIIQNLENNTIWPEDTLIRYYELMQILMDNLKERIELLDLANQSLLSMHDRDNLLQSKFIKTI